MEHLITAVGGIAVAFISFLGIMSNNKKDISNKVIDEYKSMNESLRKDIKDLKDENEKLESIVEELRKQLHDLETEMIKLKGGSDNGNNATSNK